MKSSIVILISRSKQNYRVVSIGAIRWGTRATRPLTFSDSGDIICHVPPHFLFRFRNILVSHQAVPLTFYNKIALMVVSVTVAY